MKKAKKDEPEESRATSIKKAVKKAVIKQAGGDPKDTDDGTTKLPSANAQAETLKALNKGGKPGVDSSDEAG